MAFDWSTFGVDLHLELAVQPGTESISGRRSGLERALRDAIRRGRLAPGSRLPSTRALAAELSMARGTVTAAYDQLITEGYLSARTGSGTVVSAPPRRSVASTPPAPEVAPPRYDLRPGSPDVNGFPIHAWLRATRRALLTAPTSALDYGDIRGRMELRTALAEYLGRARGVIATPDRIVITSGYVQALSLLAGVAGGTVAMEDPGLAFHRDLVRQAGARVVGLPVDEQGARTDLLSTKDFDEVRAAVLTPAHQYPFGVTLRPERRHALVEWARNGGGLVIEDDYDGEFRYDRQPVGAVQGMAADHVAYLGTASKTLAPGLRLAWMVLPEKLLEPVLRAKQRAELHTETIGALTLAEFIASHGYDRHVRACRLRYRRRRDLLIDRLRPLAGRAFMMRGIAAGLHVMITLPEGGPAERDVVEAAAERGLALTGLAGHWHGSGDRAASRVEGIVVGFGRPAESGYPAAVDTLGQVLRSFSQRPPGTATSLRR